MTKINKSKKIELYQDIEHYIDNGLIINHKFTIMASIPENTEPFMSYFYFTEVSPEFECSVEFVEERYFSEESHEGEFLILNVRTIMDKESLNNHSRLYKLCVNFDSCSEVNFEVIRYQKLVVKETKIERDEFGNPVAFDVFEEI